MRRFPVVSPEFLRSLCCFAGHGGKGAETWPRRKSCTWSQVERCSHAASQVSAWGPDKDLRPSSFPPEQLRFTPKNKSTGVWAHCRKVRVRAGGKTESPWMLREG